MKYTPKKFFRSVGSLQTVKAIGEKPENDRKLGGDENTENQVVSCSISAREKSCKEVNSEKPKSDVKLDVEIIARTLHMLQPGKSPGQDGIHPMLLKYVTKLCR